MISLESTLEKIRTVVGVQGFITDSVEMKPYLMDCRGRFCGSALMVVKPATVEEVMKVVQLCAAARISIVPQGGNTGLVGGSVPLENQRGIVLNLERMNKVRVLNQTNLTMTVESGCTLKSLQDVAEKKGFRFPLSFKSEQRCQIGGCISTNAGGLLTLRYGNTRDLVLGLEVVLPDGQIWSNLRPLYKNNTGYDLKHLFIGAEGTLGVITAAVLKLFPRPRHFETFFVGLESVEAAMALLRHLRAECGETVEAFELIPRTLLDMALRHIQGISDPLPEGYTWYVLCSLQSSDGRQGLHEIGERGLQEFIEESPRQRGFVRARDEEQRECFWDIRAAIIESQKYEGVSLKHDIGVPVSMVATFIEQATKAVTQRLPCIRPVAFGHIGDGNVHFNLIQPRHSDRLSFLALREDIQVLVHDIVLGLGGTVSAEHGIGRIKIQEMGRMKDVLEVEWMRAIKKMFDPYHLMNPGKLFRETSENG